MFSSLFGFSRSTEEVENTNTEEYVFGDSDPNIDSYITSFNYQKSGAPLNLTGLVNGDIQATGEASLAANLATVASGDYSSSFGVGTTATNVASFSQGISTEASGLGSSSFGVATKALGIGAHAEGGGCIASGNYSHAEGDPTTASGYASHAEGINTLASGQGSHSEGVNTKSTSQASHAEGFLSEANGLYSHAQGLNTRSNGVASHAEGHETTASGAFSHVEGSNSKSTSTFSHSSGNRVESNAFGAHIIGQFGRTQSSGTINNFSLQLAGGVNNPTSSGQGISVLCRTMTRGDVPVGQIVTDEFVVASASSDVAEYFEWRDGNTNNEDRVGYFVTLNNSKIEIADDNTDTIGIVSETAFINGDACELHWHNSNVRDSFGRLVKVENYVASANDILCRYFGSLDIQNYKSFRNKETCVNEAFNAARNYLYTHDDFQCENRDELMDRLKNDLNNMEPTIVTFKNPGYKMDREYVPRSQRPEWSPVGLIGKMYVRDNGECIPGQKCDCRDGIAVPGNTWFVLSRSDDKVIRILFR